KTTENKDIDPKKKLSEQYGNSIIGETFEIITHTSKGEVKKSFEIKENDTLQTVMERVNGSELGVTMFYDSFTKQMSITRNETGKFNENGDDIRLSGEFLKETLGFKQASEISGQNAIFTVNGLETERHSNTFVMNGV